MGISKTRSAKSARVTLRIGGSVVQRVVRSNDAAVNLELEVQKAVDTGLYRRAIWGACKVPSARALLRKDGSPVGISYISTPGRDGVQAAIYLSGNKSKLVRFVTVSQFDRLLPAFRRCVEFLVEKWSLNGRQKRTLVMSFESFCKRYKLKKSKI